jgi:integrase
MARKLQTGDRNMAGLYKRGKTWWGRAQRQNREFRRSLKTADKGVAEKRLRQWVDDLDRYAWGDKPVKTFTQASERFITEHGRTLKPQSARRYGVSIMHLIDAMGGVNLHDIGKAVLSDFETKRRTEGVSAPTIRRDLACLSSIMGHAVDWEWIEVNPVPAYLRQRRRKGLREAPARTRYLTHMEERALLAKATPDVRRAIEFAIDTGLRLEEQFGLTWEKIDVPRGRIMLGRETKSGQPREVPLFGRAVQIAAQMPRLIRCPYVFWHDDGRRYNNMEKGLKAAAKRAGIGNLRWHDLRRTFGCRRLQDDKLSMEQVKELLGHHSVTVTERSYAFLSLDSIERALTKTGTEIAD